MPVVIPSWLNPPDFIGAARSGARIGLSEAEMHQQALEHAAELSLKRDELAASMSQAAAERGQRQQAQNAALALREAALKQQGLLGQGRIDNQSNEISARDALDRAKLSNESKKVQFINTGNGLFKVNPLTGESEQVPNTTRVNPKTATPIAPREEVRQVLNPAHVLGGVVDTNTPAYLSLTNRTSALPFTDSTSTSSFGAPIKGAAFETNPVVPITDPIKPKYTAGQKAVQDGKTYEFDGTDWNEVNQ